MWTQLVLTILIVALLLGAEVGAEYFIKEFTDRNKVYLIVLGVVLYLLIPFLLWWLLKTQKSLTVANTVWQALNIVAVTLLGYWVFKESLSPWQITGVCLAVVATILVMIQGKPKSPKNTGR
jgi:spermidine export protein MdtJ